MSEAGDLIDLKTHFLHTGVKTEGKTTECLKRICTHYGRALLGSKLNIKNNHLVAIIMH